MGKRWQEFKRGVWQGLRPAWQRLVCPHDEVAFVAATTAHPVDSANVEVGITMRCGLCGRSWAGEVRAGMAGLATMQADMGASEVSRQAHLYARGDSRPS